jgi:hypothetical protein
MRIFFDEMTEKASNNLSACKLIVLAIISVSSGDKPNNRINTRPVAMLRKRKTNSPKSLSDLNKRRDVTHNVSIRQIGKSVFLS